MLAGYIPAWTSFSGAVDWVAAAAGCARDEARDALLAAIYDGEVESRFGDTGEAIEPSQWRPPVIFIDGHETPLIGDQRPIELPRAPVERLWPPGRAAAPIADAAGGSNSVSLALEHTIPSVHRRRGPPAQKFNQVKEAMIAHLLSGERNPNRMREKEWPPVYGACRDTCRKALRAANQELRTTNSDKHSANDK